MANSQPFPAIFKGRVVYGDPVTPRPRVDMRTKQPILKDGKQVMQYNFGVAVPKAEFTTAWQAMAAAAAAVFPNGIPPNFSYKMKDGDGVDSKGQPYNKREGYAGCYVVNISSEYPIRLFRWENGAYVQISEGIKCGDYVQVDASIVGHPAEGGPQNTPGLYINPNGVLFLGFGAAIVSGPDATTMFGAAPPPPPPGASATPLAPAGAMPGAGPTPPTMTPPGMPQPPSVPAAVPPAMPGAVPPMPPTASPSSPAPAMPGMPPAPPPPNTQFVDRVAPPPPAQPAATDPQFIGYSPTTGKAQWRYANGAVVEN